MFQFDLKVDRFSKRSFLVEADTTNIDTWNISLELTKYTDL